MENAQKALIMAGTAFMFVIAVSIGIYSYSMVIATVESILTSSEQYNQTTEGFTQIETESVERFATDAEVKMTIMSMQDGDYVASKVIVKKNSAEILWEYDKSDYQSGLNDSLDKYLNKVQSGTYSISYGVEDGNTSVVIFTKQ